MWIEYEYEMNKRQNECKFNMEMVARHIDLKLQEILM